MDGHWFDELTRHFARVSSRRSMIKLFGASAGALLAGLAGRGVEAAAGCRDAGRTCSKDGQCCSGICGPKDRTGRRTCVCPARQEICDGACKTAADYQADPTNCGSCGQRCHRPAHGSAACAGGVCGIACNADYDACGSICASNTGPDSCDTSCTPCPAPANATASCNAGQCGFTCKGGFKVCGNACIPTSDCCTAADCPSPTQPCQGTATCSNGHCGFNPAPVNTPCRPGSCAGGVATAPAVCDGQSMSCPPGATSSCSPFVCNDAQTACLQTCDDDGNCVQGAHCDPPACLPDEGLGNSCDENSDCSNGVCVGGACCAQDCPAPANGRAICSGDGLTCEFTCTTGFNTCGNGCCPSTQTCCNGVCCDDGQSCVGNACQAACSARGATCASTDDCCQDEETDCAEVCNTDLTCCHVIGGSCSERCDCCDVADCQSGTCCLPPGQSCRTNNDCCGEVESLCLQGTCTIICRGPDAPCTATSECCGTDECLGGRCRPPGCLPAGYGCAGDTDCCQTEQTFCAVVSGSRSTCCRPNGGTCAQNFDCCSDTDCCNGVCCGPTQQCCGGTCCGQGATCCNGKCCPEGQDCCNGTCCPSRFSCINGACGCLSLQSTCDPANNQCCQDEPTSCLAPGTPGQQTRHCCHPMGGSCTEKRDCCRDLNSSTNEFLGSCGYDNLCGGLGAMCSFHADCLSGHCYGHCDNVSPVRDCFTDGDCPSGGLCIEKECVPCVAFSRPCGTECCFQGQCCGDQCC